MLKIGSCTIIYNPDNKVIENIDTYSALMEKCVIVDNSDYKTSINDYFKNNSKYIYIDLNGNKGIAFALNRGIEMLLSCGMEYALTMDQDSEFPTMYYNDIIKLIEYYKKDYSVIGLNYNTDIDTSISKINDIPYWLTSGNFLNIQDFYKVGMFMDDLFIDYVDIEYGYKLDKNNLKIGYLEGYSLNHIIGNPIKIQLFNKTYFAMNHSPIRYYYRYRNSYYLYLKDKKFFKEKFFKEIFVNIPKMVLYENNKISKIKMIKKGIKDAKNGVLGKYDEKSL